MIDFPFLKSIDTIWRNQHANSAISGGMDAEQNYASALVAGLPRLHYTVNAWFLWRPTWVVVEGR